MKAQDIVDRLSATLPLYTDAFSESVQVSNIAVAGTTATVMTAQPHGLIDGQNVAITGVSAPVQIDVGTFVRTGSTAIFTTLQDHDFTLSERDKVAGGKTITIEGADQPEFNGEFQLLQVPNRRTLAIAVADSGPVNMTGAAIVLDANSGVFNGLVSAQNTQAVATEFEYELPRTYPVDPVVAQASVQTEIRILSVLDIEQYLSDVYTKKGVDNATLVVQLGDVVQSKNRNEETDAATSVTASYAFTPMLIQPFAVYIVLNTTDDLTGAKSRDDVEDNLIPAIFKAILRAPFNTGFTYSQYRATFTGHGVFAYADANGKNKAIYAHEVSFEQLAQLCREDMVGDDANVAMRDIGYTLSTNLGTGQLTADVNLDEEPT